MSIAQLKQDLTQITEAATASNLDPAAYMRDNLLPWMESLVNEVNEMDGAIEDLVHESADVLHEENGAVFAGIIAGGLALATELAQRAGNDPRLIKIIREYRDLAKQGSAILEEIVLPDDEDDEEGEAEGDDDEAPEDGKSPKETA